MSLDRLVQIPEYITASRFGYGFPANLITPVIKKPDQTEDIVYDRELIVRIFQKTGAYATDVVAVAMHQSPPFVCFAARLMPEGEFDPEELTPLENIKWFANRFGLEITVAGKVGKFFLNESIAIGPGVDRHNVISSKKPADRSCHQTCFARVSADQLSIDVGLAFCTDTDAYHYWLQSAK